MWNKGAVFPPLSGHAVNDSTMELSTDMSEMNLTEPPPKKIRRRNALTIMDDQLPSPTMRLQRLDSFESASLLQSLEDQINFDGLSGPVSEQMPGPSPFHRNTTGPKRKVPRARLKSSSPTFKQKYGLKEEISHIRLHHNITNHKPNNELLPEAIIKGFRDQCQNGPSTTVKASAQPSTALVLYTPPEKLISSILSTDADSSSEDDKKVEPPRTFRPINPHREEDTEDIEMM